MKNIKIIFLFLFLALFLALFGVAGYMTYGSYQNFQNRVIPEKEKKEIKKTQKIIPKKEETKKVSLIMAGDVLIHSMVYKSARKNGDYDFKPMVSEIKEKFKNYDLVFYNQETIIGGKKLGITTYPRFNSPEEIGEAMVWAGANLVSLSNNHTLDRGQKAVKNSQNFWSNQGGVVTAGSYKEQKDKYKIFEKKGIKFAFFAYATSTNGMPVKNPLDVDIFSREKFKKDIQKVRQKADVVLVSVHWGTEYLYKPTKSQKEIAKFLAENGADIVIGTHPHVVEPVEFIGNTLVIYSLANLLSSQIGEPRRVGILYSVDIEKKKDVVRLKNPKPELVYTYYNKRRNGDFSAIPWENLTEKKLKDFQKIGEKYLKIVGSVENEKVLNNKKND